MKWQITFRCSPFQVKGPAKKNVTPYILFSSEVRKIIAEQHKSSSFGEISRMVGDKVNIVLFQT